jgi:hypothetical protein
LIHLLFRRDDGTAFQGKYKQASKDKRYEQANYHHRTDRCPIGASIL